MTLIAQDIVLLRHQSDKAHIKDVFESYETLKEYSEQYQHLASSESAYNHLNGGRVGLLLIQTILCNKSKNKYFEKMVINNFNSIVNDVIFLNEKLTWLPPSQYNQNLFLRNIGIYLGLSVIHQYFFEDKNIALILRQISFEVELNEVNSYKHRKLLKQMFDSENSNVRLSDIHELFSYYRQSNNQVVLESIICLIITRGFFHQKSVLEIIQSVENFNNPFIKALFIICNQQKKSQEYRISFSENIIRSVMRKKLDPFYQYCGEDFMELIIKEKRLDTILNPSLWLNTIFKEYPEKTILFKNIIWREKMFLKLPKNIFSISNDDDSNSYETSNKLLLDIYKSNMNSIFKIKFKIDRSKIKTFFNSFWIGMLPVKDFGGINNSKSISEFRKAQKHTRFTILLTKRFEKVISWQGRSFRDNDEIGFFFYFFEDFRSPNDYKSSFGEKALEDFKILGLIFWCLELGIIKSY